MALWCLTLKGKVNYSEMQQGGEKRGCLLLVEDFGESLDEDVGLLFCEAEGREYPDHVLSGDACEDVLLEEEFLTDWGDGFVELDADHESSPSDALYPVAFGEVVDDVLSDLGGVLLKFFVAVDVGDGVGGSHAEVVSAEGGSEHSFDGLEVGAYEDGSDWETVGDAFGHGDEVWLDAGGLVGEEAPGSSVAALDFVEDEDRPVGVAKVDEFLEEVVVGEVYASDPLYSLDDYGCDVVILDVLGDGVDVVEFGPADLVLEVEWGVDFGVVGHGHGSACSSVEAVSERDDFGSSGVERGELERVLVGFGAAVADEEMVVRESAELSDFAGDGGLQRVDDAIGVEGDVVELLGYGLNVARVAVSYGDYGVSAVEVEVLCALVVPYGAAFGFDRDDVE